jgi:glycosyltransferase involved in cell wall biosynthesis
MVEISVIVPALNEEKYINNVIKGLKAQSFRDFETIIVDGGSTDKTCEIAKESARIIVDKRKGIGRARNTGAKVAKGKILVFIDADTKPSKGLLKAYHDTFKSNSVVAATGPILPLEKTNKRIAVGYKVVSIVFVRTSIVIGRPSVVGSNFAVRAETFRKVKGFNPELLTYEDWDLSARLKKYGAITYSKSALVYTSARRVVAWGVFGYFKYHVGNMFMYHIFKRPKTNYGAIR